MLEIIEREGVKYCVEDGCEWEYVPTVELPVNEPEPTEDQKKIAMLESQLTQTNSDLNALFELILLG